MGCWNGTCGLSGLPITVGEEIYIFPIVENNNRSFCYASALYRPSVLPFRAQYDDYGAGENCSGIGLELLMTGIRSHLVEMEVGENKYHDIEVKREGFNIDMFFEACQKHRLKFKNPLSGYEGQPKTKDVFFTMIRKDVADRLWNEWSFDLWKGGSNVVIPEGFESDKYYIKNVTYAKLAELIPEYMEKQNKIFSEKVGHIDKDDKIAEALFYVEFYKFFNTCYEDREHPLSSIFSHMFSAGYSDGGFSKIGALSETIVTKYLQCEKEAAHELLRECLIGYMVNDFMGNVRKVWMPPMHQGSQSECLDEYVLLNNITNDVITNRNKEFESDD
jgi:hypothetical protein